MNFKPDWVIHYVQDHDCDICGKHNKSNKHSDTFDYIANVHTHGLDKYGHPEICIVLDIGGVAAADVLNSIGYRIAHKNEIFTEGCYTDVLANNYICKFVKIGNDDKILYLILPDANNHFPDDDECNSPYDKQMIYAKAIHHNEY